MPVNKMLIETYLKKLKMPQVAKTYESLAREATDNNLDYEEYLLCVLEQEVHQRENNRIQRGIRQAGFPVIKTIESFDFLAIPSLNKPRVLKLMQGEYIRRRAGLINELLAAQQEYRLNKFEKQWLAPHLVILDELGYVPFSKVGSELLFQFCSSRYERGSLIITTNLEFPKWTEVLGDEQMTAALLDRLTHNAHIVNINGESYRFKQALSKQASND